MSQTIGHARLGWLCLGTLIGFILTSIMPARPLHAVATQGQDGFALATGPIDNSLEGVYFLDYLTGNLKGAVISLASGKFTTFYDYNVLRDFQLDATKSPKFLMVTGQAALRRGPSQVQPGLSMIYITELNSGICAAYAVPWAAGRATTPTPATQVLPFYLSDKYSFRTVPVRPQ